MSTKTRGEAIFEAFCCFNNIGCEKILESIEATPDYRVNIDGHCVIVEVKQIDEDKDFDSNNETSTRTVGSHIRNKIHDARRKKQLTEASINGLPTILLIYNNLDPMQSFGSEPHDFISAMYGEQTVVLNPKNKIEHSFHGRNASFREDANTSFSAVGHLYLTKQLPRIHLYENLFAMNQLDFLSLPTCFEVTRIAFESRA